MVNSDTKSLQTTLRAWIADHGIAWAKENVLQPYGSLLAVPADHLSALVAMARLDAVEIVARDPSAAEWCGLGNLAGAA